MSAASKPTISPLTTEREKAIYGLGVIVGWEIGRRLIGWSFRA